MPFEAAHFARVDESDDTLFYASARLVTHIDAPACAALADYYRRILPAGGEILDLMSSCVSHLPDDVAYERVAGLGMNRTELEANPRLTEHLIHDLNANPTHTERCRRRPRGGMAPHSSQHGYRVDAGSSPHPRDRASA